MAATKPAEDNYNKEYRRLRRLTSDLAIRQVSVRIGVLVLNFEKTDFNTHVKGFLKCESPFFRSGKTPLSFSQV